MCTEDIAERYRMETDSDPQLVSLYKQKLQEREREVAELTKVRIDVSGWLLNWLTTHSELINFIACKKDDSCRASRAHSREEL